MGSALGDPIVKLEGSILAGCKRPAPLARVYTLKMGKALTNNHPCAKLYIHVDDISNLIKANTKQNLIVDAFKHARGFAGHIRDLMLNISSKTTVVPGNDATRPFAKIVSKEGIPMKPAQEGVGIRVDTNPTSKRITYNKANG